jgi:hypothetical protein
MKNGQTIGQWLKWDFMANGNLIIREENDNLIYQEGLSGFWDRREFDSNGVVIYYENSDGVITDNRTPQIIEHNGRKYQLIPNQNPQP